MSKFREHVPADPEISGKVYYIILAFSFVWLLLILLAPLLMHSGGAAESISSFIYLFFSKVCHQQDERSFHIFDQNLAVCSRCLWIYAGFFLGTVLYPLKYKLNNTLTASVWYLLIAVLLLFMDVILDFFGIYSNDFLTRSLTGLLTGFVLPFYIIPGFVKFFYEVHSFLRNKVST